MRGFGLVTFSIVLVSVHLGSGSPAGSQGLSSLISGFETALTSSLAQESTTAVENQVREALSAAGCSQAAVKSLKLSGRENRCLQVYQSTVSLQQLFIDSVYYSYELPSYLIQLVNYECFSNSNKTFLKKLKCYVDHIDSLQTKKVFGAFKDLVTGVDDAVDQFKRNYERCLKQSSEVVYSIDGNNFDNLALLVQANCPAGTKLIDL